MLHSNHPLQHAGLAQAIRAAIFSPKRFDGGLQVNVHRQVLLNIMCQAVGFPDTFAVIKKRKKPRHS